MEQPKNILFVTVDGGGNVQPVLGVARRLHLRGHRVTVLSEPCMEHPIRAMGLDFIAFQRHFTRTDRTADIFHDWKRNPFADRTMDGVVFGPAAVVAAETERALKQTSADVLVADCLLPPALIPAEALQIPTVMLFHFPEYLPGSNRPPGILGLLPGEGLIGRMRDRLLGRIFHLALNKYLPLINKVRASYALPKLNRVADQLHQADLRLIQTLRDFDFPLEPAPGNVRYTGPVLDDPDWVDPWTNPWPAEDTRPLVVISLSSTFQNQAATIQNAISALAGLEVRGLATLGPALSPASFVMPENVKVMPSAPHSQVFPMADMVITHAGHGTIMRALAHGLPLICAPMGRDQKDNAAKVAHHGCGIRISPGAAPETIREAVVRILGEPAFREHARRLGAAVCAVADKELAITALESLSPQLTN